MTSTPPPPADDTAGGEGASEALPVKRRGRPRKLEHDPAIAKDICLLLRDGDSIEDACDMVGIAESTFYEWVATGDADLERGEITAYSDFSEDTKRARAEYTHVAFKRVRRGGDGWQAEAWGLERRRRKHFARPAQVELTGRDGGPVRIEADVKAMSTEELEQIVAGGTAASGSG